MFCRIRFSRQWLTTLLRVLFALIAGHLPVLAQTSLYYEDWRWSHFTTDSGLPSDKVFAVLEASDSTIWAVTAGGTAWYDGFRWNNATPRGPFPSSPAVSVIASDGGNILIDVGGDIYKVSRRGPQLVIKNGTAVPFSGSKFLTSHTGRMGPELALFENGKFSPAPLPADSFTQYAVYPWTAMTKDGAVWLGGSKSIYRWQGREWEAWLTFPPANISIADITENTYGGVLSLAQPLSMRGIWEWKTGERPKFNGMQRGDWIKSMDISSSGDVVAVDRSGHVLTRHNGEWEQLFPLPGQMRSINRIRFSSAGSLLIGGDDGAYIFSPDSARWQMRMLPPPNRGRVCEVLNAADGTTWLATADGVERRGTDGSVKLITSINGRQTNDIIGLAEDRTGNIWISSGVSFDGAYRWDGKEWKHFAIDTRYPSLKVHKIRRDKAGNLWFLSMGKFYTRPNQPGAFKYDGKTFTQVLPDGTEGDNRVYSFAEGPDSTYWFGTRNNLVKFKNNAWTRWQCDKNISGAKVFALAVDSEQNVWFSDRYSTIGILHPSGKIEYVGERDGLVNTVVSDIVVDSTGKVWLSTEHGIAAFDHGKWFKYDAASGLQCPNIWPIFPQNGKVYAGTLGSGLAILDLAHCNLSQVAVTFDEPVIEEGKIYLEWHPTAFEGNPGPKSIYTRYRVANDQWSDWSFNHAVTLRDLPAGTYKFEVEALNLFQSSTDLIHVCQFSVLPPFYLRLPFVLPLGIVSLALIGLIARSRENERRFTRELQSRETKLSALALRISQTQEAERRSVATYLHDEISQALGYCKMKLALLNETTPGEDLSAVHSIVSELYEKARVKTFDLSPHVLYELGLAEALQVLAEKMEEQHRIAVIFEYDGNDFILDDDRSVIVFRAVQELLVNVTKHAAANAAHVTLSTNPAELVVVVEDDGKGINPEFERSKRNGSGGFGLFNMRERIGSIGGSVHLMNTGEGTRAVIKIPLGHFATLSEGDTI